jgi:hypothetical protein
MRMAATEEQVSVEYWALCSSLFWWFGWSEAISLSLDQ